MVAIAIESEYPLLRESKHPVLLLPDNKPVQDAVSLIKQGKFSASARMNRFLNNVNKVPISVKTFIQQIPPQRDSRPPEQKSILLLSSKLLNTHLH